MELRARGRCVFGRGLYRVDDCWTADLETIAAAPLSSGFAGPSPSSGRRALFSSSQLLAPLRRGFFSRRGPSQRLITTRANYTPAIVNLEP